MVLECPFRYATNNLSTCCVFTFNFVRIRNIGLVNVLRGKSQAPIHVATGVDGQYYASFSDGFQTIELPHSAFADAINKYIKTTSAKIVAFGPKGCEYVQFNDGTEIWTKLPYHLQSLLNQIKGTTHLYVEKLSIGPNYQWFLMDSQGNWQTNNLTQYQFNMIKKLKFNRAELIDIQFGKNNTWVVQYKHFGFNNMLYCGKDYFDLASQPNLSLI